MSVEGWLAPVSKSPDGQLCNVIVGRMLSPETFACAVTLGYKAPDGQWYHLRQRKDCVEFIKPEDNQGSRILLYNDYKITVLSQSVHDAAHFVYKVMER